MVTFHDASTQFVFRFSFYSAMNLFVEVLSNDIFIDILNTVSSESLTNLFIYEWFYGFHLQVISELQWRQGFARSV